MDIAHPSEAPMFYLGGGPVRAAAYIRASVRFRRRNTYKTLLFNADCRAY